MIQIDGTMDWEVGQGIHHLYQNLLHLRLQNLFSLVLNASLGLLIFAGLTADNLRRASAMPVVAAHGWAALAALMGLLLLGLSRATASAKGIG